MSGADRGGALAAHPLLHADDVTKTFVRRGEGGGRRTIVQAVRGVTLSVAPGEILGLVGESGSGKSTFGRLALGLLRPTTGRVLFDGQDVARFSRRKLSEMRRHVQVVFQDPYASLNPRMTIGDILHEPMLIHGIPRAERDERVRELLELVGIETAALQRKPAEFSGGQQQRIAIARALTLKPRLIVADEAVSALDVSIQAQIVNLFMDIRQAFGVGYLFISHNLAIVRHISDRVAVMYLGEVVELGSSRELYAEPRHPYTKALLSAVPVADPVRERRRRRIRLPGDPASPTDIPDGCSLHGRCPVAIERCAIEAPRLAAVEGEHLAACHLARQE